LGYGGGGVIPGGMMPFSEKTEEKIKQPVPQEIRQGYDDVARLGSAAAGVQYHADQHLYDQEKKIAGIKIQAAEDAALQQRQIAEERDSIAQAKLREIESLNKQAAGKPEDIWNSEVAFGRFLSFALMAIGTAAAAGGGGLVAGIPIASAGGFINSLIDQDIGSKLKARDEAGKLAGRQTNLLNLHNERLNNKAKAVDATKLAYYDSALTQLEKLAAEHRADVNPANYLRLQGQILEERTKTEERLFGREQGEISREMANRYRPPQVYGGGGAGMSDVPHKVTLSDNTTYALDTEKLQGTALAELRLRQELQAKDLRALQIRQRLDNLNPLAGTKEKEEWLAGVGELRTLQKERMDAYSVAAGQGVNTKADVEREEKYGTMYTAGFDGVDLPVLGRQGARAAGAAKAAGVPGTDYLVGAERRAADRVIRNNIDRNDESQKAMMRTFNAELVQKGYNRDPATGRLSRVSELTGQSVAPNESLPPAGTRPLDPRIADYPTRPEQSVRQTTPKGPILSATPGSRTTQAPIEGEKPRSKGR
jgi:hypothetical protein